jgi:hypothetical protein
VRRGLIRGAKPWARRVALLAVSAGGAVALALFFAGAFAGADAADKYGRVELPGRGEVELPEGDVALYYEERVTLSENESLDVPDGLVVTARREKRIRSERTVPNSISLDGRALREFGKLVIPQAGTYRVRARSKERGSNTPAVTFGEGQLKGLATAGKRTGLILGGAFLIALIALLVGRRTDPGPGVPAGAAGMPAPSVPGVPTGRAVPSGPAAPSVPTVSSGTAAPSSGSAPQSSASVEQQLRDLKQLHESGALTQDEYDRMRREVLESSY